MIRPARPEAVDIALAGLTAVWAFFLVIAVVTLPAVPVAVGLLTLLAQAVAILLRRTSTTVMVVAIAATAAVQSGFAAGVSGVPLMAVAVLTGLHGGGRLLAACLAASAAVAWGLLRWTDGPAAAEQWLFTVPALAVLLAAVFGIGRLLGVSRSRERRRQDAAEQERAAAALTGERRRIADDLAAVVLEELRRVATLAAGVRVAVEERPEALADLQLAARRSLASMRRTVTALRAAEDGTPAAGDAPPRRWWEPGRPGPSGYVLAGALTAATVLTGSLSMRTTGLRTVDGVFALLDLPLDRPILLVVIVVQLAATAWWRAAPIPALAVVTAASVVLALAGATQLVAEFGWTVLVYAVGAWAPVRASATAVAACCLVVAVELAVIPSRLDLPPAAWVLSWVPTAFVWILGVVVRGARLRVQRLRAADADSRLRSRLDDERHRIARDLHDLVAHHASAVAVQAAAARSEPAALPAAVGHIEESGRAIADAVRGLAGLGPEPEPGVLLTRDALLDQARSAGVPVEVEVHGEPSAEPGEADLFARRILAEALTNVLRHAGPSPTRLRVGHEPGAVTVEVHDAGPAAGHRPVTKGAGLGLVGMRERAALLGGTVEAGPDGGGWRVVAHLPRTPHPASALHPG